ncbi:hypothetical protein ACHAWF_018488, partial [Thalassiosira exigua]
VDVVWLKDPLEFFHSKSTKTSDFDVLFQNDGSNLVDMPTQTISELVIVQLLLEHPSSFGLNVKVFDRDTDLFPDRPKLETGRGRKIRLLFLRQLGEWYVTDNCIGQTAGEILRHATSIPMLQYSSRKAVLCA